MLDSLRARRARKSFDYQWRNLPEGRLLLSDPRFRDSVDTILSEHELLVAREWFEGRRVLDAGCGNGRWIEGFLRLGCEVTAVDQSSAGLAHVRETYGDRVRLVSGNVLEVDRLLEGEQFDLVFCWGVLHHTEDPMRGLRALSRLVGPDGLLYLYLYGIQSISTRDRALLSAQRWVANVLPARLRQRLIERRYGSDRAHNVWDMLSTPLNYRYSLEQATAMIRSAGLERVTQTVDHSELFLRADRGSSSADPYLLPPQQPPYYFEQMEQTAYVPS